MHTVASLFVRFRGLVGWTMLAITAVAAFGYVSPSRTEHPLERYTQPLLSEETTYSDRVQRQFDLSRSDAFLVVRGEDLFTPKTIGSVRRAVEAVEALRFVDSVFWIDRVPVLNVFGFADPLVPPDDASPQAFRQAEARLREHALAGQLISEDGRSLMMPIVYDWLLMEDPSGSTETVLAAANDALADGGAQASLTGRVPLILDQQKAFDRNQIVFQAIGYTLALVLSAIMFRGFAAVFVVATAPAIGVFWTLGIVKLLGLPENPLATIVMPVMVAMVGLTDGVHLLVHVRRRRAAGAEPIEAARSAIEKVGLACWLTSITTAIGFASLLLARSDYVQDFGRICSIGVLIAFVAVVTFIPWVCSTRLGRYVDRGHERDIVGRGVERLRGVIDAMLRRRAGVSVAAIAVTVALTAVSMTLEPDNQMKSAMPSSSQSYRALAYCDEHFGGIEFFRVGVLWPEGTDADDPKILAVVRDVEELIRDEPLLSRPLSIRTMLASFPGDSDDLGTQATFVSLMPAELSGYFHNASSRWSVISVRMQDKGLAKYKPVFDRLEARFGDLREEHEGFRFLLAGQPVNLANDLYQIVEDLRNSLITASVIILVVLGVVYRSARIGLLSIVPNLFPLVFTAGLLIATGRSLDMSSVCAFVVCLGIAVDDTIHFLSRFRQELAEDGDVHGAIRRSFVGVGSALVMTTVILCSGFGTMLLSDLPGHRTFAAMACSTIAAAVVGDLIALPALLSCFYPRPKGSGTTPADDALASPRPAASHAAESSPGASSAAGSAVRRTPDK